MPNDPQNPDFEYIVIGSGAGGGPVACNLARAGHTVGLLATFGQPRDLHLRGGVRRRLECLLVGGHDPASLAPARKSSATRGSQPNRTPPGGRERPNTNAIEAGRTGG